MREAGLVTDEPRSRRRIYHLAAEPLAHQFTLDMPGYGKQRCKVLEVDDPHSFVYTFTPAWTLTWRLVPEGTEPPAGVAVRIRATRENVGMVVLVP